MIINSTLSITLRLLTILSKFIFAGWMITNGNLNTYGEVSVVLALITFGTYILGFEFYYLVDRLVNENGVLNSFVAKMITYTGLCLCLFLLNITFCFDNILLSLNISLGLNTFVALLFLESSAQEITRLLIAKGMVVVANVLIFSRVAIWPLVAVIFNLSHLNEIFNMWLYTLLIVFLFSTALLYLKSDFSFDKVMALWGLGLTSRKLLIEMYLSNIAHRSVYSLDKIMLSYITNTSTVGLYSFYMNIVMALNSVWDASILSKNLSCYLKGEKTKYISIMINNLKFFVSIMTLVVVIYCISDFVFNVMCDYLPVYFCEKLGSIFEVIDFKLIVVCFLISLSIYIYQDLRNYLYARGEDRVLLKVNFILPFLFFCTFPFFAYLLNEYAFFSYVLSYSLISGLLYRRVIKC